MKKLIMVPLLLLSINGIAGSGSDLDALFGGYESLQTALAGDNLDTAKKAVTALKDAVLDVKKKPMDSALKKAWSEQGRALEGALDKAKASADIKTLRGFFESISNAVIAMAEVILPEGYARFHCPMAFNNKGADWLQKGDTAQNPYFGSQMLRCGYKVKTQAKKE